MDVECEVLEEEEEEEEEKELEEEEDEDECIDEDDGDIDVFTAAAGSSGLKNTLSMIRNHGINVWFVCNINMAKFLS